MKNKITVLILIILIAVFFRFNQLKSVPASASLDEASIGWNAYSILKTGADEYSTKFPILLRAYDDWRPALYVYLVIPFIALLDLNVVAVRLPSVLLSILTVVAVYFLVKELLSSFWQAKRVQNLQRFERFWSRPDRIGAPQNDELLALLTSFLLAISPWHIYISRLGHEVNAGLAFFIFGILFFFMAKNFNTVPYYSKKTFLFLCLSFIFFSLSFYTYQSEKIFVPLLMVILILLYRKELLKIKKYFLLSFIVFSILTLPILFASLSPNALARFSGVNVFNNHPLYTTNAEKFAKAKESSDIIGQIINNRKVTSFQIFTSQYLSHLSPKFLFGNSGNESFKAPNIGLFYLWQLPFMIIGVVTLILNRGFLGKTKVLIISWIGVSFIAPSITTEVPHAMRAYNALPALQILIAIGIALLVLVISNIKYQILKIHIKYLIFTLSILFLIFDFLFFLKNYFVVFPKEQSHSFQYALSKAIPFVLDNEKHYDRVIFSNEKNLYQSYMFFLFYSRYDPFRYQKLGGTKSGGFAESHAFDKYEFRPIDFGEENIKENRLYIGNNFDFADDTPFVPFYYLDGKLGIKIVQGKHE